VYKVLLHIGLPKTATSALQHNVLFPLHQEGKINFLGRYSVNGADDFFFPMCNIMSQLHEYKTQEQLQELRNSFLLLLDSSVLNVISEECLSVTSMGQHQIRLYNLSRILEGCSVDVLLSLRNPVDFMFSYYVELYKWQYFSDSSSNSFEKFAKRVIDQPKNNEFDVLFFERFIAQVKLYFSHIHIILFEDLKYDPLAYFDQLAALLPIHRKVLMPLFLDKQVNTRVASVNGKFAEAITLNDMLNIIKRQTFVRNTLHPLKKIKMIKKVNDWVILIGSRINFGSVEHLKINGPLLEDIRDLLLLEDNGLLNCDRKKLEQYDYLK